MDEIDRAILNEIQSEFPITERPYYDIGKRLNLDEIEVLERIIRLKEEGIIRRIGGNFNSDKLQYTSTLCAAMVPEEKLELFVEVVNGFSGVTHNYLREHKYYNVWFTFIAKNEDEINNALDEIKKRTGIKDILNLPSIKKFKIRVDFEV